ncbi:MAG: RNase adapter RapZ [Elusimicrobiaceae bacterium]|nr:RNase adapter RapZ [Elusimicrobiaceae bacterium]
MNIVEQKENRTQLRKLFEQTFGAAPDTVVALAGDGSDRRLFRLKNGSRSAVGVSNADRLENAAFLEFSRHFRRCGLPVPEIYAETGDRSCYLEEDLGDTNLFQLLARLRKPGAPFPQEAAAVYSKAVKLLPRFQITAGKTLDYKYCHPRAEFDRQSMMWDLNYFKYYFLRLAQIPFNEQKLEDDFNRFTQFLLGADRDYFLYRDFQSRNIMVRDAAEPWFVDYQGGRRGALQYDMASLLFDGKADLPHELREQLLDEYLQAAAELIEIEPEKFRLHYYGFVHIRIMQALGAYGLRGFYEKKVHFLHSIPYAVRNLEYLLRKAKLPVELPELRAVFERIAGSSYLRNFGAASPGLTVRIQSFSFKKGLPPDQRGHGGGFTFDCRALPNPGRYPQYAQLTGQDPQVKEFMERDADVKRFLEHVFPLVEQSVENYRRRNFTDLAVSFGCTGGRHRSVFCAEALARRLREKYGVEIELEHAVIGGAGA